MKKYDELLYGRYFADWGNAPASELVSLLKVKTQTVIPNYSDKQFPDFKAKLNIKLGIDPTGADIHIGHLCPVILLNLFQKFGHHVDFVIGDFTAKIGDPSGRNTERAPITDEQIAKNFATYVSQISPYIDTKKFSVRQNSEWLAKVTTSEYFAILQKIKLSVALQREDFRARLDGISLAEVCYASLMGLDSVNLNTNIELGGNDQLLNLQQCRIVQEIYGQKSEVAMTVPIIEGIDGSGRKMSKSFNNYIAVTSTAEDKFGKFMSLPDDSLLQYYKSFGYLYDHEIKELEQFIKAEPMEAKKQLATYFVSIDGRDINIGKNEREKFEKKFSKKELTTDDFQTVTVTPNTNMCDAIYSSGKFGSKGEVKRILMGNGVTNTDTNEKIGLDHVVTQNINVKVGKLNFFSIKIN